ncbi:MAG TPA: hypothetical protein VGK46_07020 [Saprospiraceae bacterium]
MNFSSEELFNILSRRVSEDTPHRDFQRTVDHANWCYQIVTGDDQKEILVSYKVRETQKQVEQRIRITNSRTQYVSNKVKKLFNEVHRCDDVVESIGYANANDTALADLTSALNTWYEGKPLNKYITGRFKDLSFEDPNAYIISEFENDDPVNKKPTVYPFEVRADEVYDHFYVNGVLKYLITQHVVEYKSKVKNKTESGKRFTMYGIGYSWVMQHIPKGAIYETPVGWTEIMLPIGKDRKIEKFIYKGFESKTTECPAFRVGYMDDPSTRGRTKVSPMYPAEKIITDLIWNKSEYDLSKALHGFYQKFAYVDQCGKCHGEGSITDDYNAVKQCTNCKGSGKDIHSTVQDIVLYKMPSDPASAIKLSDLVHFAVIPESLIKMQREDFVTDQRDVFNAIFGANVLDRSEIVETATAKNYDWRAVNNTLYEYADQVSEFYKFTVRSAANHRGESDGLQVQHSFPSDFKLESVQELIDQRSSASTAGASNSIISTIDLAILAKQHKDDPDFIKAYKARERFKPMSDKPASERMILLTSTLPQDDPERILYLYYERIMSDIFDEHPNFPDYPYKKQKAIVYGEVEKIRAAQVKPNITISLKPPVNEPQQPME